MAEAEAVAVVQPLELHALELARDARVEAHEHEPAVLAVVLGHALGQRRPVRHAAPDHPVAEAQEPRRVELLPAQRIARVGAPDVRAERAGVAARVGGEIAEVVGAGRGRVEGGVGGVGRLHERLPVRPASHHLGAQLLLVAAVVELRRVAQDPPEQSHVLVELAVDHVRAVAAERVRRRVRQDALLGVHAGVFVRIAQDELAGRERAPAPAALRHAAAGRPLVAVALDRGLCEAVAEAEVLARVREELGVLLVHHRHGVGHPVAERVQLGLEVGGGLGVDRKEHVRRARAEVVVPIRRGACAGVAEQLGSLRHAVAEFLRERVAHVLGHAERVEPRVGHGDVERGVGLRSVPRLGRGDAVHQAAEPRPARPRLGHAREQVRGAVVGVAVGAQDVALDVGALEGGRRHQAPISASKAALSWAGDIGSERSARSIIRTRSSSAAFTFAAVACP